MAPHRCWLTARRAPERWAVQTLKHQEKHQTRSSEKRPRFYKQVPAKLCWTHRSWAAQKDRHCPQGTPPLGTELGLQGHGCGLPPHPLTQGTQAPPTSKVGWAQGQHEGLRLQCQGRRLRRPWRKAKAPPHKPLAPWRNSHSSNRTPWCLCSPLQLFSKVLGAIFWKHRVHVIFFQFPFVTNFKQGV